MIMTILGSRWKALALVLVLAVSSCTAAPYQQALSSPITTATGVAATPPESVEASNPVAAATPVAAEAPNPAESETPMPAETMSHAPSAGMEISTTVAAAPAGQALAQGGVLYQDDFTDPKSGWPNNLEFGNYYIGYHEPNHYHVEVHVPHDSAVVAVPKQLFTDFTMASKVVVAPNNTAKTGDFRYGLVFRRSGNQYYAFVVSPRTKSWYVLKSSPSGLVELKKGSDDSIQGLTAEDTLRVDAKGSSLFFHINDQAIGQVSDADYANGEVGFLVETLDSPRAHIHYGMTTIREVEAAPASTGVLYQDDFTDPMSGWPNNLEFGNYYIGYHEPNHYHVEVHVPHDRAVVAVPKRSFTDFTMASKVIVAPNNTAKTGDFRYGLVFRRSGNQYYAFVVSPRTKSWSVLKSSPSGLVELKKGSNDSIQGLTAEDTLRVDAKGSNFFFHINDQAVGQVSDADYANGEVGFLVETLDSPRAHIHYGTTTIREVEAPQLECTVITQALKIRAGPGTMYNTIATARRSARFEPLARNTNGLWIYARAGAGDATGWISSSPGLVYCNVPVNDLAVRQP